MICNHFRVEASDLDASYRTIKGPDGISCPAVPAAQALYIASLMETAYLAGLKGHDAAATIRELAAELERVALLLLWELPNEMREQATPATTLLARLRSEGRLP